MDRQARTGDTVLVLVAGISNTVKSICTLKITTEENPIKTKNGFPFLSEIFEVCTSEYQPTPLESCS
jgi:hypothetical protein